MNSEEVSGALLFNGNLRQHPDALAKVSKTVTPAKPSIPCAECKGNGHVPSPEPGEEDDICLECNGTGTVAATYRGWNIRQGRWPEPDWMAEHPNFDASWEGEEDGWVSNGLSATAATYEALCEEIDIIEEERAS